MIRHRNPEDLSKIKIIRQIFNVGASATAVKKRDKQFRKAAKKAKERIRKYIRSSEFGMAFVEADAAAEKIEKADKYKAVSNKLRIMHKMFEKALENNKINEDLMIMMDLVSSSVRSRDIERIERAIKIYDEFFKGNTELTFDFSNFTDADYLALIDDDEVEVGDGDTIKSDVTYNYNFKEPIPDDNSSQKSLSESILEGCIRDVSRESSLRSQTVLIPNLAMNLAKKEKPLVDDIIKEINSNLHQNSEISLIADNLLRRSSLLLPELDF